MQEILAITLHSMHQDMKQMEHIGKNLANMLTPGYKRDVAIMRPFAEYVGVAEAEMVAGETRVDARAGTFKASGQRLDLALAGDGFFEVSTDNGLAYTRQGNFHVDARGRLVTAQGYPVMGKGGEIVLSTAQPVIDAAGNITEADPHPVAQLKIVRFDDAKTLRHLGDNMFAPDSAMTVLDDADIQLRQGYLENSNVSSMQEMVKLMQTMRHIESMQRVAQGYDEMVGTAIRKLGEV